MSDVICFGEALIDFVSTATGVALVDAPGFEKAAGGAPANVAVGLARLGISTGFIGKVGDDPFGHFLYSVLQREGVDVSAMRFSVSARTALAFVSLKEDGDRDFMFYRHPSADMLITSEEIDEDLLRAAQVFHFGSISLITEPSRSSTLRALEIAAEAGLTISYDPNLRFNLWPDAETAKAGIQAVWERAHVIKISQEELIFLAGVSDPERGGRQVWHPDLRLLVITQGRDGCTYLTQEHTGHLDGIRVDAIDTTGAGDAFVASLLMGLHKEPEAFQDEVLLREVCQFANAAGAHTTTIRGAIPAMPTSAQVEAFLEGRGSQA
jgi:fructokinase